MVIFSVHCVDAAADDVAEDNDAGVDTVDDDDQGGGGRGQGRLAPVLWIMICRPSPQSPLNYKINCITLRNITSCLSNIISPSPLSLVYHTRLSLYCTTKHSILLATLHNVLIVNWDGTEYKNSCVVY